MEITEETREEIKALIWQAFDQREQQITANKYVYRRICGDFEQQLKAFDYTKPATYVDEHSVTHQYDSYISCGRRIQDAISCLLRIAYQVNVTANLPAEKESNMRCFMSSVLELMAELKA